MYSQSMTFFIKICALFNQIAAGKNTDVFHFYLFLFNVSMYVHTICT